MPDQQPVTVTDLSDLTFCPRSLWLRVNGVNVVHEDKVRGNVAHARVDGTRSIAVHDDDIGLYGKVDAVDHDDGSVQLVEYKSVRKDVVPEIRDKYVVQLAAYRHCLESMGIPVSGQSIWFTEHKHKATISDDLIMSVDVAAEVSRTRDIMEFPKPPPPLEDDTVCHRCPLVEMCNPSDTVVLNPRIVAPTLQKKPLILGTDVKWVGMSSNQIVVKPKDGSDQKKFPIGRVSSVTIPQSCSVSSSLMVRLAENSVPVVFTKYGGKVVGYAAGVESPGGMRRSRVATLSDEERLNAAKESIRCKALNQASVIGRYGHKNAAASIRALAKTLSSASTESDVFGVEGGVASIYFAAVFNDVPEWAKDRGSVKRVSRTPTDPVNMILNRVYGMLRTEVLRAVLQCGLDPAAGVLHSSTRNKPALVLDLMEMFRPVTADTVMRTMFAKGMLSDNDFSYAQTGIQFKGSDKWRYLVEQFDTRMNTEHEYVDGGYRMTWRRTIDYVVRGFVQYIDGDRTEWKGVCVR